MSAHIEDLTTRAQEQYRIFTEPESPVNPHIVTPSIPVLYFGNLDAHRESSLKVSTVGHNPPNKEFECAEERFSGLEEKEVYDTSAHLRALNEHFEGGSE